MAEPKKRLTSSRSGSRRSHLQKKPTTLSTCQKCHSKTLPHRVCLTCGYYRGKDILKLDQKAKEKEDRRKQREAEEEEELNQAKEIEKQAKKKGDKSE